MRPAGQRRRRRRRCPRSTKRRHPAADPARIPAAALAAHEWTRHAVEVTSGDSLYGIFIEEDFSVGELVDLLRSGDEARHLKRLLPGQKLDFYHDDQRSVQHLVYHLDGMQLLHFFRTADGFSSARVEAELDRRIAGSSGEIRDSFYLAARQAGLSERLVMEVAEIFAWDVDFALDVWEGDRFSVIYEELYQPDGTASDGAILAAEFVNRGHRIRALRYEDAQGHAGYYLARGTQPAQGIPAHTGRIHADQRNSHSNLAWALAKRDSAWLMLCSPARRFAMS